MKVPFFVPWINKQDKDAINKALTQRWLTNGPLSQKFEEKFQKFLKLKYSLTTSSATHALHLSLRSIGIKQGDEVIVPTFTFTATADVVSYYPTKIITTGEGGMLTTNDKEIFNKSKSLRSHSMTKLPIQRESEADWKYDVVDLGFNYRLDEIRSALGLSQLARINLINKY